MNSTDEEGMDALLKFLDRLEQHRIKYVLERNREDAIMVLLAVPGERWEIELSADGTIEVERFVSNGSIGGADMIEELFRIHTK